MYTKVYSAAFINAFREMGREHQFSSKFGKDSSKALYALYDYLDELERESGQEIELDVIALCCDFVRFDSIIEYNQAYGTNYKSARDIECFACSIGSGPAFICHAH